MKITFLSPPPNLSGGQRVKAIYARELVRMGHDVNIVCSACPHISKFRKLKSLIRGRGWPNHPKPTSTHYVNYGVPHRVANNNGRLTENDVPDADVVIATFWTTAEWAAGWSPRKGKKFYLIQGDEGTIHGDTAENTYERSFKHIYVSNWIRDRVRYRHPNATGLVINNAVDVEEFDRGVRNKPPKLRVGMMWAGSTIKGGDVAIDAVRMLRRREHEIELIAFGASTPPRDIHAEIDFFELCPSPTRIADIYATCTCWLFTSRFEGFGLPILEAMAARTPVLATPTGAAEELISQGGGVMIPMDDPATLADTILKVRSFDNTRWMAMSEAAYNTANSSTWGHAAKKLESFLEG
jgi:glycosyltransferase involved in cell wall biosynthesis